MNKAWNKGPKKKVGRYCFITPKARKELINGIDDTLDKFFGSKSPRWKLTNSFKNKGYVAK